MADDTLCVTLRLKAVAISSRSLIFRRSIRTTPRTASRRAWTTSSGRCSAAERDAHGVDRAIAAGPDLGGAGVGSAHTRGDRTVRGGLGLLRSSDTRHRRDQGASGPGRCCALFRRCQLRLPLVGRTGSMLGASGLLLDVAVEGLSVASWVAIWWPLDQLLHASWQLRLDERSYRTLQGIHLRILPDPEPARIFPDGSGLVSPEASRVCVSKRASRSRAGRETPQKTRR